MASGSDSTEESDAKSAHKLTFHHPAASERGGERETTDLMMPSIRGSQSENRFQHCFKSGSHEIALALRVPPKNSFIVRFKTNRYGCTNEGRTLTVLLHSRHRNLRTKMRRTPLFGLVTFRE